MPSDLVAVGRIVDAYGIHGWVKVETYNQTEESVLSRVRRWWIRPSAARGPAAMAAQPAPRVCEIERARTHGGMLVAKPHDSFDRDTAVALKGHEILASRGDFPAGGDDEFYWGDLVGCSVTNPAGEALGLVFAVEDYGAHPILRLKAPDGPERMIPFVGVYIVSVDLSARRIVADWALDF